MKTAFSETFYYDVYLYMSVLFIQGCNAFAIPRDRNLNITTRSLFVTECTISQSFQGFCVNIHNCANKQWLRTEECGPSTHNPLHRQVCCEPGNIREDVETTTLPSPPKTCGYQSFGVNNRIFGGEESAQGEFPWTAKLFRSRDGVNDNYGCTGVLIHPKVVLTAAHCIASDPLKALGYLHVVTFEGFPKAKILITHQIVHHRYNKTANNYHDDIGLIILKEEVNASRFQPICVLQEDFEPTEYYIGGWGKSQDNSESLMMMKTSLPPYSWEQCIQKYNSIRTRLTNRQICAGGEKDKDACSGDSGGPLMVVRNSQWFVAGIVSFGVSCGKEGWPGVYTNIPSYVRWIENVIAQVS